MKVEVCSQGLIRQRGMMELKELSAAVTLEATVRTSVTSSG